MCLYDQGECEPSFLLRRVSLNGANFQISRPARSKGHHKGLWIVLHLGLSISRPRAQSTCHRLDLLTGHRQDPWIIRHPVQSRGRRQDQLKVHRPGRSIDRPPVQLITRRQVPSTNRPPGQLTDCTTSVLARLRSRQREVPL